MPIPYSKLKNADILHHQAAYECFDKAGKSLFPNWDMIEFEKAVLGCGDAHYLGMADEIWKVPNLFGDLDRTMPFLKFGEDGQHYAYELFLSPPRFWGGRGAPLWWAYVARKFTFDKLPMDEQELQDKYNSFAAKFRISLSYYKDYYIERFAAGGMSSGMVGSRFVREGWRTVRDRNKLYKEPAIITNKLYLAKAKERIDWYCNDSIEKKYISIPEIDENDFLFELYDSKYIRCY